MQMPDEGTQDWVAEPPAERPEDDYTVQAKPIPTCEVCGAAARIRVLEGYDGAQPVQHDYCLTCGATAGESRQQGGRESHRLSWAALIALAGVALGVLGVSGDLIGAPHIGFGYWQRWGVLLGALAVFMGGVLRTDLIMLGGLLAFSCSVGADWIGGGTAGFGWKQEIALLLGGMCLLTAGLTRLRQSRQARRRRSPRAAH